MFYYILIGNVSFAFDVSAVQRSAEVKNSVSPEGGAVRWTKCVLKPGPQT